MFNWLQHLFTARALERELSDLCMENAALKLEVEKLKQVIAVKDEELRRIKDEFESFKKFHNSKPLVYPKNGIV